MWPDLNSPVLTALNIFAWLILAAAVITTRGERSAIVREQLNLLRELREIHGELQQVVARCEHTVDAARRLVWGDK